MYVCIIIIIMYISDTASVGFDHKQQGQSPMQPKQETTSVFVFKL